MTCQSAIISINVKSLLSCYSDIQLHVTFLNTLYYITVYNSNINTKILIMTCLLEIMFLKRFFFYFQQRFEINHVSNIINILKIFIQYFMKHYFKNTQAVNISL